MRRLPRIPGLSVTRPRIAKVKQFLLPRLAWLLLGAACVAVLPGSLPELANVHGAPALYTADATALSGDDAEDARQAWLRGREAAADADAARAAAQAAAAGGGATTATPAGWLVPPGADGAIPPLALRAYRYGANWAAGFAPGCNLTWSILAGIGRIESNHGRHGGAATRFSPAGDVHPAILGPPLDGRAGSATIRDSDRGRLDNDLVWDRAVGPMQFLPSTWRSLGRDGNNDKVANPGNFFDSAVSAAAYLCLAHDGDLSDQQQLRQALYAYNHSWDYVDTVLGWAAFYGESGVGAGGPPVGSIPGAIAAGSGGGGGGSRQRPATTTRRVTTTTKPGTSPPPTRPTTSTTTTTTMRPTTTAPCLTTTTTTSTTSTSTTTTTTTTTTTSTTTTTLPPCP
jgi:hypothetical protein